MRWKWSPGHFKCSSYYFIFLKAKFFPSSIFYVCSLQLSNMFWFNVSYLKTTKTYWAVGYKPSSAYKTITKKNIVLYTCINTKRNNENIYSNKAEAQHTHEYVCWSIWKHKHLFLVHYNKQYKTPCVKITVNCI